MQMKSKVIIKETSYFDIQEAVEQIMENLQVPVEGKNILIKPNLLHPTEPEQGINTHPALIRAVVKSCQHRKAGKIMIGDNAGQRMYGKSRQSFFGSHMGADLEKYYVNLGLWLEEIPLHTLHTVIYASRHIREADIVINLPKFKTHKVTGISGAIKNTFGYIPGGQKSRIHVMSETQDKFAEALSEIHAIKKPDITICDAVLGMQGNGASSTDLKYIGKLIASTDPVALDSVIAQMMGMDPKSIRHIVKAEAMGLGTMEFQTNVPVEKIENFDLAPGYKNPELFPYSVSSHGLYRDAMRRLPNIKKSQCIGCGKCVRECPVEMLQMRDNIPVLVKEECAGCHACQEACGCGAITLE